MNDATDLSHAAPAAEVDEELIRALGRSELLGLLRPLLENPGMREVIGDFLQFAVVVDSNVIYSDLYFQNCVRLKNGVQPTVKELLASKTILGFFPHEALGEMDAKCVELSDRYDVPLQALLEQWKDYQRHLRIIPTTHIGKDLPELMMLRDANDAAFIQARTVVGADAVLTQDKDIGAAGVPIMPKGRVLLDLRDYARNRAVRVAVVVGTGTAIIVPLAAIVGLIKVIRLIYQKASRGLLLGVGVAVVIALLHPKSREFLIKASKFALQTIEDCAAVLGPAFASAMEAANHADARAAILREVVEKTLGHLKKAQPTLKQAVCRACLVARVPLTVEEIWASVAATGIKLRARDPLRSVRIALRRNPLLICYADGRWGVRQGPTGL